MMESQSRCRNWSGVLNAGAGYTTGTSAPLDVVLRCRLDKMLI